MCIVAYVSVHVPIFVHTVRATILGTLCTVAFIVVDVVKTVIVSQSGVLNVKVSAINQHFVMNLSLFIFKPFFANIPIFL